MNATDRNTLSSRVSGTAAPGRRWLVTAILAGVTYLVVGQTSAALAGAATSPRMRFAWRLSAFIVSGLVLLAHVAYERFRLGRGTRAATWHATVGAALGGFALALAANLHDLGSPSGYRPRMLVALLGWPLLTAAPAFVVALVAAAGLGRSRS